MITKLATEVDMDEDHQSLSMNELMWVSQLQKRVDELEIRVKDLETRKVDILKKKKRRKAAEIERKFVVDSL